MNLRNLIRARKKLRAKDVESGANEPLIVLSAVLVVVFYLEMASYVSSGSCGSSACFGGVLCSASFSIRLTGPGFRLCDDGFRGLIVFLGLRALEYGKLVTSGPYRYVRHPQYAWLFLCLRWVFLAAFELHRLAPLLSIPGWFVWQL